LENPTGPQQRGPARLRARLRSALDRVSGASDGRTPLRDLRKATLAQPSRSCVTAVEHTAKRLAALGHVVGEADLEVDAMAFGRDFFLLACLGAATSLDEAAARIGRKIRRGDVETATWLCAAMARQASAVTWTRARARLNELSRRVAKRFENIDVLLTPTLASPPVAIGALEPPAVERAFQAVVATLHLEFILRLPGVVDSTVRKVFSFMPFTALANVTG